MEPVAAADLAQVLARLSPRDMLAPDALLAARDRALLFLTAGTFAGVALFATIYPGQTMYFLLPAYVSAWMLVVLSET